MSDDGYRSDDSESSVELRAFISEQCSKITAIQSEISRLLERIDHVDFMMLHDIIGQILDLRGQIEQVSLDLDVRLHLDRLENDLNDQRMGSYAALLLC